MSKDTKDALVKNEAEQELEELATEDDGSEESEEEETEEEGSESEEEEAEENDDDGARERDGKGRFKKTKPVAKPTKKDKGDEEEESEEEEEPEGEEEEESEGEEETEEEEEPTEDKGPKSRSAKKIQQLVESRNKANERIANLEGQIAALTKGDKKDEPVKIKTSKDVAAEHKTELEELYEKVEEARADSNIKEAAKLQRRIDEIKELVSDAKATESEVKAKAAARAELENERFDTALDLLLKVRPIVDQESEEFDARVYKELAFQVESYEKNGLTPYAALRRACRLIFVEDPFEKPTASDDTGAKKVKKDDKAKKTDVKKNVAADKKQPPRGGKHSQEEGTGEINVDDLTDEELLALPPAKLARLDGSLG